MDPEPIKAATTAGANIPERIESPGPVENSPALSSPRGRAKGTERGNAQERLEILAQATREARLAGILIETGVWQTDKGPAIMIAIYGAQKCEKKHWYLGDTCPQCYKEQP